MPLVGNTFMQDVTDEPLAADAAAATGSSFCFVPRELITKCRQLIESYHAIYG
jgi:hypothetical protein